MDYQVYYLIWEAAFAPVSTTELISFIEFFVYKCDIVAIYDGDIHFTVIVIENRKSYFAVIFAYDRRIHFTIAVIYHFYDDDNSRDVGLVIGG